MISRLVLGFGSIGSAIVDAATEGQGRTFVLTDDTQRVTALREENVAAEAGDPTDPDVLASLDHAVDIVIVAGDDPAANLGAARAARDVYPDAVLVAHAGTTPDTDVRESLSAIADHLVDPRTVLAHAFTSRIGGAGLRLRRLCRLLRDLSGPLAIVTHDNPDPDAIASAVALGAIAETVDCPADVFYFGDITHQENRAFINLLDISLRNIEPGADLEEYAGIALVDHSRPGINDQLPPDTPVDVVIDHHPPRAPIEARFVDLRSDVGATSTLLVDYLRRLGLEPDEQVATALLFGIRVDTKDFSREVSVEDFEAAAYLLPHADPAVLERIESPSMSAETLDTIARAIRNRRHEGAVLTTCVGRLGNRDTLAQAADRLLDMEGVRTTLVFGLKDDTIYLSGRSRGTDLDLGEALREAFGQIGSAGGHADMAGAQVPLGLLSAVDEERDGSLADVVCGVMTDRFMEVLRSHPRPETGGLYPGPEPALVGVEGPPTGVDSADADRGDDATTTDGSDGDRDGEPPGE